MTQPLAIIRDVQQFYHPTQEQLTAAAQQMLRENNLTISDIDAVMTGLSGDAANDRVYQELCAKIAGQAPVLWYKHLFGESFSASAIGLYVTAVCLQKRRIPASLYYDPQQASDHRAVSNILFYNHFQNIDHSLILVTV